MKNKHAQLLAQAAIEYLNSSHKHWPTDLRMLKVGTKDYLDLMNIAGKIENNEDPKRICRLMDDLDTLVRDVIPKAVYDFYNS